MKKLMALLLALLTCFAAALADTASAPDIPQGTLNGEVTPFTPGQTYAVYSAPDSRSIRGAKGRARVSTNGWIQVFGAEGDWLLVQYAITPEHCRIGYIDKNALPQDAAVPALTLEAVPAIVSYDVLADGTRADFCGTWEIQEYDTRRERYWNESEFELTLSRGSVTEQYGLRICRQMTADGGYKYARILSDGTKESSMVLE